MKGRFQGSHYTNKMAKKRPLSGKITGNFDLHKTEGSIGKYFTQVEESLILKMKNTDLLLLLGGFKCVGVCQHSSGWDATYTRIQLDARWFKG